MNSIVIGFQDQESSAAALTWAADEADRRGWSLQVLHALQYPGTVTSGLGGWYPAALCEQLDAIAVQALDEARETVLQRFPDLDVSTRLVHLHPRLALTEASETAGMVVTGARRSGALAGSTLGSTSMHVVSHAHCPVAVVPHAATAGARGVVVGHDGSPAADEAVAFAAEEAAAAHEELLVVRAWPLAALFPLGFDASGYGAHASKAEVDQHRLLDQVATRTRADHAGLGVRTDLLVDVFAAEGLVYAAKSARLLVVGTRGHGTFASMLLGSTSHNILHAAEGPVVVVPDYVRAAGSAPVVAEPTAVPTESPTEFPVSAEDSFFAADAEPLPHPA